MRWWKHLYMGEHAGEKRAEVLRGIREKRMMPDTYVITLPESGNHILDIRPVLLLTKEEREGQGPLILGVASGKRKPGSWCVSWWMICTKRQVNLTGMAT